MHTNFSLIGPLKELEAQLKPLPENWAHLTKLELAFARLPKEWHSAFDLALPQTWLDEQAAGDDQLYCQILSQTVWFYPPVGETSDLYSQQSFTLFVIIIF